MTDLSAVEGGLENVWLMVSAALVFMMQGGFLLLEAGTVRSKNSVNVAQKNLIDFLISSMLFLTVGFSLMFGISHGGWIGYEAGLVFLAELPTDSIPFFVFQVMFCGTAATIVSGAVAERMTMSGYILITCLVACLIYPLIGHWVWGGHLNGSDAPFLAAWGMMDFAGGAVVHLVGGAVALAAVIVVGPRRDKFAEDGTPRTLHGHSPVLSTSGCLLIWVGWIGFNGGSTSVAGGAIPAIILNTMVAGAAGGLVVMAIGRFVQGHFRPEYAINGSLAGLVGITAGADVMLVPGALMIGGSAGAVAFLFAHVLEHVFRQDDPLGAIAVHGAAGAYGAVMLAVFGEVEALALGSRLDQAWVQIQGVTIIAATAFSLAYIGLRIGAYVLPVGPDGTRRHRVSNLAEKEGLNAHEHDAPMGTGVLATVMAELAANPDGEIARIELDMGDEAYDMSLCFNEIVGNMDARRKADAAHAAEQAERHERIQKDVGDIIAACADGHFDRRLDVANLSGFERDIAERINRLCDVTTRNLTSVADAMTALAAGDLSQRVPEDQGGLLGEIATKINGTMQTLDGAIGELQSTVRAAGHGDFSSRMSLDGREGFFRDLSESVNDLCRSCASGLDDLGGVLARFAKGDLTGKMSEDHLGQFARLSDDINTASSALSHMIGQMREASSLVSQTSSESLKTNATLRSASQDQADLLETARTTLGQIDAMAKEGAEASRQAAERCSKALAAARDGSTSASDAAAQLSEMARVANAISASVDDIGDIAFRTHLLSINASVEAARENGQDGFRVVAEEVRNLAARAAEVVQDIQRNAEEMNAAFAKGRDRIQKTHGRLQTVLETVEHATALSSEVRDEGDAQAARVSDLGDAISEVSRTAKKGAHLASEAEKAARLLSDQAAGSDEMLNRFKTYDDNGPKAKVA